MESSGVHIGSFLRVQAAIVLLICWAAGTVHGAATGTFTKLFVFGDSYVDTGNRDPNNGTATPIGPVNQAWRPPYGQTHPGYPAGHFCDGDLLAEFLGKYMGLNPRTYRKYQSDPVSTATGDGMNFAVGGAGVFNNLGFTKTSDQIAQFKALLDANVYSSSVVSDSVILFAISGNDYAAYARNLPGSNVTVIVTAVVNQMVQDLQSLYVLGFRNFVISEMPPLECLPSSTAATEYLTCVVPVAAVPLAHNLALTAAVAAQFPPSSSSPANVIFLDNQAAFYKVLSLASGLFRLKPCCVAQSGALCGDLDSNKKALYTVCNSTSTSSSPFFWDENHPTEAGWRKVFNLYKTNVLYTHAKSLPTFLGL